MIHGESVKPIELERVIRYCLELEGNLVAELARSAPSSPSLLQLLHGGFKTLRRSDHIFVEGATGAYVVPNGSTRIGQSDNWHSDEPFSSVRLRPSGNEQAVYSYVRDPGLFAAILNTAKEDQGDNVQLTNTNDTILE